MQKTENEVTVYVQQVLGQVRRAVVGKDAVLLWVLAAILARGHILLEDIPGVGKTTMALFPFYLLAVLALMVVMHETMLKKRK